MKKCIAFVLITVLMLFAVGCNQEQANSEETKFEETKSYDVAQIVIDYENKLNEEINTLSQENPEYNYYYHPVNKVSCRYILGRNASADTIVEKYDMNAVFAGAEVSALNRVKMIIISFDRDDFTEAMHQKIQQISDEEFWIEDLVVNMESNFVKSYMPKIEYYTNNAAILDYEIIDEPLHSDEEFIVKTKKEYDNYLDYLLEIWTQTGSGYPCTKDTIDQKKDLYDDAFFEENALIITKTIYRGSGSIKLTVNNLYVFENKVYVVVRTDVPNQGTANEQYTHFAFKVSKKDVVNVNEVITLE